jgi:phosphoribosyl 1,2-cyclic phosphodiesterase
MVWSIRIVQFSVLSSGSKANCTFIEVDGFRILIDCGLSGKQCELRLAEVGVAPDSLDCIFVTHEHHDHIHGVATLSKRYGIPVYANAATMSQIHKVSKREIFRTGEVFMPHGAVKVTPFSITHDALDPVGFVVEGGGFKFVHVTDLGRVTTLVREHVRGAHAIVLESNHDQEMLQTCDYTWDLKQRIASTHGHLCNDSAGQLLEDIAHPELFHVILGHLSENSNTPDAALSTAHSYLNRCMDRVSGLRTLLCGSVYKSLPLLELDEPHQLGVVIGV